MLMQGAPPAMQAVRDAAAAAAAGPGPVSAGAPATGAAAPPSRLKGTIVGVAAPAAGAAPAPPMAGAGAPAGAPNFPSTLAFDPSAPPPQPGFGADGGMGGGAPDQHQFGGGANPLGATFAIGQDSPGPFGGGVAAADGAMGGAPPPAAGSPYGAPPADGGFGGGAPGGYGAPPADGGFGGAPPGGPFGGPPPGGDPMQQGYGQPPGGAPPAYGQQPGGGFGNDPMQQMNQGMQQMNPYGGGAPGMMGPMGNPMGMVPGQGKSWMTTLILACVAGTLGVHRFYTGYMLFGALQLITCGGFGIWTLIDIIFILTGKYTDAQGRPLVRQ